MNTTAALITGASAAGALIIGAAALGVAGGKRAVNRRPKRRPQVLAVTSDAVQLERTPATAAPGRYRIRFGTEDTLSAIVGDVLSIDEHTVTRALDKPDGPRPAGGDTVLWTGYVFDVPAALGLPYSNVLIPTPSGPRAAYLFTGAPSDTRWAIHVHGIHSSRTSALRSVPATAGHMPSLVVSYRGDAEDPTNPPATLGQDEAADVDAAISYALEHGADDVVLIGWSMGATISMILASTSKHRDRIAGLAFVGPALDWPTIIRGAAQRSGIPGFLAPLFTAALTTPGLAHAAGLARPLRARHLHPKLDGTDAPVLIIHSPGDSDAPYDESERLHRAFSDQVELERFEAVPHGMEWNSDPARFAQVLGSFLDRLP